METVNKYVTAASTAIWGQNGDPNATQITQQHGEEPLSGVQGKGDTTDPYDAGNREEQPDAPKTDGNTAPQEPNLGGKTQTFEEAAVTSDPVATKTTTEPATSTFDPEDTSSTAAVSNSAQPISSGSTESNKDKETDTEQRDSSQSAGESSAPPRPAHPEASIEALEGPQGPPPKPAEEFEKEAKGKAPVKDDTQKSEKSLSDSKDSAPKDNASKTNDSPTSSNKSSHSQESGKSSKLAKVKESVKKHLHHSSK
ncbi:unnamed protein product [Penicillium salamii]|uniref:Uncharacterized protein n=1 Tax=Penicillium salamii TaxID=1612424 RepID=A0A9W4K4V9_9EURO|nr:unnamed protein product [Penicillium salamii]CAG8157414.1 unnamed protein product [Penicillium salamii]CAG8189797.1 unnamed protein product [Penicillium salamii]CAG8242008.1 unnamed protein product [Penicillium salamii]CAG8276586.1 unnamed protein product [Penicillium salamii]